MRLRFHFLMLLLLITAGTTLAQTGKITGRVTEAGTGDALPGVNVFVEGTTRGATSDVNGNYVMIGIRPGQYTVSASFIGYRKESRTSVSVNVDLTTTVDFVLQEEAIEGEEIVVTADAVAVRKDLTSSEARITSETIDQLPVTELGQLLDVQAGITSRDGLHIRGGRSSEVVFMVDGVPVTDSYDGSTALQLENDGIEELQVISGTFNAEYGNAMSGIVNVVTKEGRNDTFGGSVEVYSGSYAVRSSDEGEAFLRGADVDTYLNPANGVQYSGVDPYGYLPLQPGHFNNFKLSLDGPLIKNRATLFLLGRYFKNDGWLYGADLFEPDGSAGSGDLIPMNNFEKFSWQANLKFQMTQSMTLNLIGLGSISNSRPYSLFRRWSPEGRFRSSDDGYDAKIRLTHVLSSKTFYAVSLASFNRHAYGSVFEDPFDAGYNDFDITPPDTVVTGQARYARGGTSLGRFDRTTQSYMLKADLSSQLGQHHLVKAGFLTRLDQLSLESYSLIPAIDESGSRIEPFQPAIPNANSSAFQSFEDVQPITISGYIQDKMEFDSFIVNAGIRVDYFDSRADVPADPSDPNIFNPLKKTNRFRDTDGDGVITELEETPENAKTVEEREAYWWTSADPKLQVSPRLGVAYPITEQGVIHFSFGVFFQIPTLNNLFDNFGYKIPALNGTYGPFGNPNLDAQRSTMYEIGFKQGFGPYVIDMTAYYRDVRSWVSTSNIIQTALPGVNYVVFTNRDYANTRGVTLSASRQFSDNFGFDINYTYQVVEGSNSNPADEFFALLANRQPSLALLPLSWDQRHKIAGAIYGGARGFGGSLRFRNASGFPYTPSFPSAAVSGNDVQPEFASNSRRMPGSLELDLSVSKEFTFGRLRPRIYAEVFNLLDARNVLNVFSDTGRGDLTLEQFRQGSVDPGYWIRPEFYSEPRRIQLGLDFKF